MKKAVMFCFVLFICLSGVVFPQGLPESSEITSSVPALTDFHEIIFPMWHNAYPERDINALKGFVPQIKTSMEAINKSVLPGILRDKDDAWKKQLISLNASAENYYSAADGNDAEALLAAAEKLHHQYEMMVRVIRPVLKEIDDYHQTLYIIYHKLYPDKKYDEIAQLMDILVEKADAITKYPPDKLKKRLGDNISEFEAASKELYKATVSLKTALSGNNSSEKDVAVQVVHTRYQNLESVFK